MKDLAAAIANLRKQIERRGSKPVSRKCRTFLKSVGIKRRTAARLAEIRGLLEEEGIAAFPRNRRDEAWESLPLGETIEFVLKDSSAALPEAVMVPYAGTIAVARDGELPPLWLHQEEAINALNRRIIDTHKHSFAGLLVIPTGGGKTRTAVQWLLRNYVDKHKRVLWIAHRHELLEQTREAFHRNAHRSVLLHRETFSYRVISGIHDQPVHIQPTDDVVIASKDSLNASFDHLVKKWVRRDGDELFLVVDEAHHSVARTYRDLIDRLRKEVRVFKMLGLTATPFRTDPKERPLLGKMFADDIVFKVDLTTLIGRGILAEPEFRELRTGFDMVAVLTEDDWRKLRFGDVESLSKATAGTIATNARRNRLIVNYYLENRETFGQTLVYAMNIDNAIALNALLCQEGVRSDYVISGIQHLMTGVTMSPKENSEKIERFRVGELDVLVSVNILTEGTDLPKAKTAFLTRPTISPILVTQMMGRVLRGPKAGGKSKAYIVSFIDDWKDKIAWVNPESVFITSNVDFAKERPEVERSLVRLVSIAKIEEFARMVDQMVDTSDLEKLDFIERIPVGVYSFSLLRPIDDQHEIEKDRVILVFDNIRQAYSQFIEDLPALIEEKRLTQGAKVKDVALDEVACQVEDSYFFGCEKLPGYRLEDVCDVLLHYALYGTRPQFIELKDRDRFDVTSVATELMTKTGQEMGPYLDKVWRENEVIWKTLFGYQKRYFEHEVTLALRRLWSPEEYRKLPVVPEDVKERRRLEQLQLSELRERAPQYWRRLVDEVYVRSKDDQGHYTCALTGVKSMSRLDFQIDHITPFSEGGLTVVDNLRVVHRPAHAARHRRKSAS